VRNGSCKSFEAADGPEEKSGLSSEAVRKDVGQYLPRPATVEKERKKRRRKELKIRLF